MRRSDREITETVEIDEILSAGRIMRLALCDGGMPYVVPLNFGRRGKKVYFHCAVEGKKLDILRRNPRVALEVTTDLLILDAPVPCGWTTKYRCVMGFGTARILEAEEERLDGLAVIMEHHGGPVTGFNPAALLKTAVVEIIVDNFTGKRKM